MPEFYSFISTILNFISTNRKEIFINSVGAFFGAFFAFLFFIMEEKLRVGRENKNSIKIEHAYLECYLYEVKQILLLNKEIITEIIQDYKVKNINIFNLSEIPIRDGTSVRIKDILFRNEIEFYMLRTKILNLDQNNFNNLKDKINNDLTSKDEKYIKRGENSLNNLIELAGKLKNGYDLHLNKFEYLIFENKYLLQKYKNIYKKIHNLNIENEKRKKQVNKFKDLQEARGKSFVYDEYIEMLDKHNIKEE
jgi:hypothetical protein